MIRGAAILLSVLLVAGLLSLTVYSNLDGQGAGEEMMVRAVSVTLPPPPPPPPPKMDRASRIELSEPPLEVSIGDKGASLAISTLADVPEMQLEAFHALGNASFAPDWEESLQVEWSDIGLEDIDAPPQLLRRANPSIPHSLKRQGVSRFHALLLILIDEEGNVYLKDIVENPYPELEPVLRLLARSAKFTKPRINGVPVRALYHWKLEFRS